MQTPQNTTPHDHPHDHPHDRPRHAAGLIAPRELYIAIDRNNRPRAIRAGKEPGDGFRAFIDDYRIRSMTASNDLMLHYRLPEGMRIPDWEPYRNGRHFGDYLCVLLPLLRGRNLLPVCQCRSNDAHFCNHRNLDPTAPGNARERLLLRDDYYAFMDRRLLPYEADNRNLCRGITTDRGTLLVRADGKGESFLRHYLRFMADNFFHPQTPGGRLSFTEAITMEDIPVPPPPALPDSTFWHTGFDSPLPDIDPAFRIDPADLLTQQVTASYDLTPTGVNYLRLCAPDRGERIVPTPDNANIALLDCLHRSAALPEGSEGLFHSMFDFRSSFSGPLKELRALDPDTLRASELRASISERAGALLEKHYPLRRREQEPGQEQTHDPEQERTRSQGRTL